MADKKVNHIVMNGVNILDLRSDTVDAEHLAKDFTAHDASGNIITGTMQSSGVPIPDPIVAGNTPVWADMTLHTRTGAGTTVYYSFVADRAGTYRIQTPVGAEAYRADINAKILKNGNVLATFEPTLNNLSTVLSVDEPLSVGDEIKVSLTSAASRPFTSFGLIISIEWHNTFVE